jgi:Protein phosphatase 2C
MSGEQRGLAAICHSVGGASCRGALHERRGLPNQDAIRWSQDAPGRLPIVLAVADGHGGAAYFRSDVGAGCAVEVAVEVGAELAAIAQESDLSAVKREAEERLPGQISRLWNDRVERHLGEHPLTDDEQERLAASAGAHGRERFERDGASAYGATLLFAIVTSRFIVFGQLGDGELLWVDPSGETSIVFESAPGEVGEETASLCMKDAPRFLKIKVAPLHQHHPPLILAATDGYSKSFVNDAEFLRIGGDYLKMVRDRGVAALADALPGFLSEATASGSGDDITLGFIRCSEDDDRDSKERQRAELEARFDEKADREEIAGLIAGVEQVQCQVRTVQALQLEVTALLERVRRLEAGPRRTVTAVWLGSVAIAVTCVLLWFWLRSGR